MTFGLALISMLFHSRRLYLPGSESAPNQRHSLPHPWLGSRKKTAAIVTHDSRGKRLNWGNFRACANNRPPAIAPRNKERRTPRSLRISPADLDQVAKSPKKNINV